MAQMDRQRDGDGQVSEIRQRASVNSGDLLHITPPGNFFHICQIQGYSLVLSDDPL
jgi:hypothetical protein